MSFDVDIRRRMRPDIEVAIRFESGPDMGTALLGGSIQVGMIGLADAPLVGSAVESVLYVVEAGSIHAGTVRIALDRLRTAHVNLLGAVLTKFEAKRAHLAYGYDYGYGYGR